MKIYHEYVMSNGINLIKIQLYHEFTNKMSLILNLMAHSGEITTTTIYFNQTILQYDKIYEKYINVAMQNQMN